MCGQQSQINSRETIKAAIDRINREYGAAIYDVICQVAQNHIGKFLRLEVATEERDMHYATDFELHFAGSDLSYRQRRHKYWMEYVLARRPAFTLRSVSNALKTELDKICKGYGDWYLYTWEAETKGIFAGWIFVDTNQLRSCGLLGEEHRNYLNKEQDGNYNGTGFRAYSIPELMANGCVLAASNTILQIYKSPPRLWYGQEMD